MSYSPDQNKWAIENGYTGYEDYLNNQRSSGGDGGNSGTAVAQAVKIKPEDLTLLQSLDPNKIKLSDYEAQALAELTPYYERLLAENNNDVEKAKQRLEEDYKTGVRQQAEDVKTSLTKLLGSDIPQEQKAQLESLNQRGMLGTILNQQARPQTTQITANVDTGTASAPQVAGKPVISTYTPNVTQQNYGSVTQTPVTTAQFGGLAGRQIAETGTQQDARKEAITRAFTRYNEAKNIERQQNITDTTTTGARTSRNLTQEKAEKVPVLAGEKYTRALNENTLKRQTILEPYQLEASGITGMLKY